MTRFMYNINVELTNVILLNTIDSYDDEQQIMKVPCALYKSAHGICLQAARLCVVQSAKYTAHSAKTANTVCKYLNANFLAGRSLSSTKKCVIQALKHETLV